MPKEVKRAALGAAVRGGTLSVLSKGTWLRWGWTSATHCLASADLAPPAPAQKTWLSLNHTKRLLLSSVTRGLYLPQSAVWAGSSPYITSVFYFSRVKSIERLHYWPQPQGKNKTDWVRHPGQVSQLDSLTFSFWGSSEKNYTQK